MNTGGRRSTNVEIAPQLHRGIDPATWLAQQIHDIMNKYGPDTWTPAPRPQNNSAPSIPGLNAPPGPPTGAPPAPSPAAMQGLMASFGNQPPPGMGSPLPPQGGLLPPGGGTPMTAQQMGVPQGPPQPPTPERPMTARELFGLLPPGQPVPPGVPLRTL